MTITLKERIVAPIIPEIADKEYLGRMPIVGRTPDGRHDVVAYFPTGRSAGSRARYLAEMPDGTIKIDPSADAKPGQGNPALIYYNALRFLDDGSIVVTNGVQTDLVVETYEALKRKRLSPLDLLQESFRNPRMMDNWVEKDGVKTHQRIDITEFEPDHPNYTPRVSAVLGQDRAAMSIAMYNNGVVERHYFDIPLVVNGIARGLPTYTGKNVPEGETIPQFRGSPMSFAIPMGNAEHFANAIWNSLGPKEGEEVVKPSDDFRVGVVVIFRDRATHTIGSFVINKNQPKPK